MKFKVSCGVGILFILTIVVIASSCQNEAQLEFKRYYSAGSLVYQTKCQNCHGAKGEGLAALIPPLTDQVYLKANKSLLACFIKNGLKGKITVSDRTFEGEMPANDLSQIEIAEVITYITNSFGNKLGTVTSNQVDVELRKCPLTIDLGR